MELTKGYLRYLIDFDLLRAVEPLPDKEYIEFVDATLIRPDNNQLSLYIELGWQAEVGELSQVLCKSLRPGYPIEKTRENLISELGDCIYWLGAASIVISHHAQYPRLDEARYFDSIMDLIADEGIPDSHARLYTLNRDKLMKRAQDTGSFTK